MIFKNRGRGIFSPSLPVKLAAFHDLSGYGKASLTVVIPVLSKEGIEVCPLPTSVLSTHTYGFPGYSFFDLTKEMSLGIDHWIDMGLKFNALYSGFLGSEDQIEPVTRFIEYLNNADRPGELERLIVVDPVMGDKGKLYGPYSDLFIDAMRRLTARADLITPNLTEASFLLGEKYPVLDEFTNDESILDLIEEWSRRLLGSLHGKRREKGVVITGVPFQSKSGKSRIASILSVSISREGGADLDKSVIKSYRFISPRLSVDFPGTGDYYTSCLIASILKGKSLKQGVRHAVKRSTRQIKINISGGRIQREGLAPEMKRARFFK